MRNFTFSTSTTKIYFRMKDLTRSFNSHLHHCDGTFLMKKSKIDEKKMNVLTYFHVFLFRYWCSVEVGFKLSRHYSFSWEKRVFPIPWHSKVQRVEDVLCVFTASNYIFISCWILRVCNICENNPHRIISLKPTYAEKKRKD